MARSKKKQEAELEDGIGKTFLIKAQGYKKGAILGAVLGFGIALIVKKRYILLTAIGAIAGGYAGFEMVRSTEDLPVFKNYDEEDDAE